MTPGEMFGEGPAREPHVDVKECWVECCNLPEDHPDKLEEFLHRQLNEELNVLENAASNLTDFPDADWRIRMWIARQCADEARHALVYARLLRRSGASFGDYPVMNFQYKILRKINTLIGRLAVQNRTFEADGLDAAVFGAAEARQLGDEELAEAFDAQAADEILHVWFANEWINAQVKEKPRRVLDMATALTLGSKAFDWVFAGGGQDVTKYPVAEQERLQAGFDSREVEVAAEMSRARRQQALRRRRS